MNILVTGGAGFIGSHLVEELVSVGHRVRVLDNLFSGSDANLSHISDQIEFVQGDVGDFPTVLQATKNCAVIFHLAAIASVQYSVDHPLESNRTNIQGTLNCLQAAREHGVERFIFSSSSAVYGNVHALPIDEQVPTNPLSPYGIEKLTSEYYCRIFYSTYGLQTISLRYFNIFGPRQNPTSQYAGVIPRFITAGLKDEAITIYGTGNQTRDFLYVKDVVNANLKALKASRLKGEVLNIAGGQQITINSLATAVAQLTSNSTQPNYVAARNGDIEHSQADIQAAHQTLQFKPQIEIKDGLAQTVTAYRS